MGDSSGVRGSVSECSSSNSNSNSKARLSFEEGLTSYAIVHETTGRLKHARTRSSGGHGGSTLSLNSSSSYHKFCHHSSPVSTPKASIRHEFCGGGGINSSNFSSLPRDSRMVRSVGSPSTSSSSGYHSKPNSPILPRRGRALVAVSSGLQKWDSHHKHHHHHHHHSRSDNGGGVDVFHMSSSSSGDSSSSTVKGKGKKGGGVGGGGGGGGSGRSSATATFVSMHGGGSSGGSAAATVHKRNLYIVSYPIILLFNIFRSLLYQLFVLLRYVYCAAVQRRQHFAELQRQRQREKEEQMEREQENINNSVTTIDDHGEQQQQLIVNETSKAAAAAAAIVNNKVGDCESVSTEAMNSPRLPPGPGPADPLLAKQKHHHRRAFECISKALKIDEENEGE